MSYVPLTYRTDGGNKIVVASGGTIDIESGGALKIAGTQVTASAAALNALGASATDFDCGASGTAGSLDIFPTTAANGKLIHTCTDNGGARNLTLTNVAQTSGSGTLKYPDMAGGTGQFAVTNADQKCTIVTGAADRTVTLGGNLTTTGAVSVGAVTLGGTLTTAAAVTFGGAYAATITVPSASTWVLPTGGGTLALATGAETGTTESTFTIDSDSSVGKFALATNTAGTNHTVTLKAPVTTQAVTLTLPDAATDTLCAIAATQTLAAKTLTAPVINGATTAAAANNFTLHTGTGAFTTPTGTFTHYGNVTNNGNITFDFSGSSGAFTTSTGTNTLSGHTTTASGKNLTVAGSGTFTTGTGAVTVNGATTFAAGLDIAFSGAGDGTLDMSTQTGIFKTSSGANTLSGNVTCSGTVTLATTKGLAFGSAAAGTATPITAYSLTANKGALIISVTDATTDHATTLTNSALNGAAATITLPNATCTLSGLGLAETVSGVKTFSAAPVVTLNDTTDGVVNATTLTHSSSDNNATVGDGVGISFQLENATGTSTVEEWASLDVVSTTITNGSEDGDLVVSAMLAGTVTEALRLDASDQSLSIGRSSTDANGLYRLRVFPVTGSRGSLVISATANTDDHSVILTNSAVDTADKTITLPAATCTLVGRDTTDTLTNKTLTAPVNNQETVSYNNTAYTAAGSTTADATVMGNYDVLKVVGVNGQAGYGVRLPTLAAGRRILIINTTAFACELYPHSGGTIDGLAADASVVIGASKRYIITCTTADTLFSYEAAAATAS